MRTPAYRPSLGVIFLTVFLDLVGFGLVIPLLPSYSRDFGATGLETGLLFGVYSLMQLVFAPWWGALSDRIGRRPVLLASLGAGTLAYAGEGEKGLRVTGEVAGVRVEAVCERREPKDFLLMNRGFHWVNETPFNR